MKKLWVLALAAIICTCASTGKVENAPGVVDLDTAIQMASMEINDTLPAGMKVALLNFNSGSDVFSDYVLEEMSIALVKERKLTVVDRKEIDLIRGEMNFQMSGDVSDESAQEIGMMLGAQSIVSGSMVNMGDTYRFRTKAIHVITAAIQTSSSISVKDDSQIQYLLSQGTRTPPSAPAAPQNTAPAVPAQSVTPDQSQPAAPALTAYKVGDTGPAGGIIFYDKGNNNNGWRYLEAAPDEAEFVAIWSVHSTRVENTREEIGYGRRNTQLIVAVFKQTSGEWDTAAQKCDDLVFNGFNDWFLPSKGELDQMYGNLKRKNLGGLKNEWYWSSTERPNGYSYASSQSFRDGRQDDDGKRSRYYVRPIRQVPGPEGAARSSADGGGTGAVAKEKKSFGKALYSVLGVLLLGGLVAFLIWGPSPSGTSQAAMDCNLA